MSTPDATRMSATGQLVSEGIGGLREIWSDGESGREDEPASSPASEMEAILQALPAAIYTTDLEGRITFYNEAAAKLWGVRPELHRSEFCGSWKLYWPDGSYLPHDQCPMAIALKEGRAIRGKEAIAERPDGTRVPFLAHPTPLFDQAGILTGAVNMLVDISGRQEAELAAQRLAAIVESSDDAILSRTSTESSPAGTGAQNGSTAMPATKSSECP